MCTRLCGMAHLVMPFWGNVSTVLPEDGLVEAELDELVLVAQLFECGIQEQRREVHLAALARAERTEQRVVAQILYICNRQFILFWLSSLHAVLCPTVELHSSSVTTRQN